MSRTAKAACVGVVAAALLGSSSPHAGPISYGAWAADKWTGTLMPGASAAADKAADLAKTRCKSSGGKSCEVVATCSKPGWSGVGTVYTGGLPYGFVSVCGVSDKTAARTRLKNLCRERTKGFAADCFDAKLQQLQ